MTTRRFELARTAVTPHVLLDAAQGTLVMQGDCYPENPPLYFGPFLEALDGFLGSGAPSVSAAFRLRYVNSAATKVLSRVIARLERAAERGADVRVSWHCDADDEGMRELFGDLTDGCLYLVAEVHVEAAEA
jgi:hypothetical protein